MDKIAKNCDIVTTSFRVKIWYFNVQVSSKCIWKSMISHITVKILFVEFVYVHFFRSIRESFDVWHRKSQKISLFYDLYIEKLYILYVCNFFLQNLDILRGGREGTFPEPGLFEGPWPILKNFMLRILLENFFWKIFLGKVTFCKYTLFVKNILFYQCPEFPSMVQDILKIRIFFKYWHICINKKIVQFDNEHHTNRAIQRSFFKNKKHYISKRFSYNKNPNQINIKTKQTLDNIPKTTTTHKNLTTKHPHHPPKRKPSREHHISERDESAH